MSSTWKAGPPTTKQQREATTTFCRYCGHVGPIDPPALACCPEHDNVPVHPEIAAYAQAGFIASLKVPYAR